MSNNNNNDYTITNVDNELKFTSMNAGLIDFVTNYFNKYFNVNPDKTAYGEAYSLRSQQPVDSLDETRYKQGEVKILFNACNLMGISKLENQSAMQICLSMVCKMIDKRLQLNKLLDLEAKREDNKWWKDLSVLELHLYFI